MNENTCRECKECPRNSHYDTLEGHKGICLITGKKVFLEDNACSSFKK